MKYRSQLTLSHKIGKIVDTVITSAIELTMDNENISIDCFYRKPLNEDNFETNNEDADLVDHHTYYRVS